MRIRLQQKVLALVAVLVMVTGFVITAVTQKTMEREIFDEHVNDARIAGRHLAKMAAPFVVLGDGISLEEAVEEFRRNYEEDFKYILVTDPEGSILAHTFPDTVPGWLRNRPVRSGEDLQTAFPAKDAPDLAAVIVIPIDEGRSGQVHIGVTSVHAKKVSAKISSILVPIIATILILGILLSYALSLRITSPLRELVSAVTAVGDGDLARRATVGTTDEIGELGSALNRMTEQLSGTLVTKDSLHKIINEMHDIMVVTDDEGVIIKVNEAALRTLGYDENELVGQEAGSIIENMPMRRASFGIHRMRAGGDHRNINMEVFLRRKDGGLIPAIVSESVLLTHRGEIESLVLVAKDITERKRFEEIIQEDEELLRATLESTGDGILVLGESGQISHVNEKLAQMWGLPRGLAGITHIESLMELMCPQLKNPAPFAAAVFRKGPAEFSELLDFHDGRVFDAYSRALVQHGEITGRVWSFSDISKMKITERALKDAKEFAEAANAARTKFFASMSHEIRTPLNAIIGITDLVMDTEMTPEQREYLGMVSTAGESLLDLLNNILDFSKIESDMMTLRNSDFDLHDLVVTTMQPFRFNAREKGIVMKLRIEPGVPRVVHGDPLRLRQVVMNILGNAVKFTNAGEISIHVTPADHAGGGARPDSHGVVGIHFAVSDTGVGIPEERRKNIFESFIQGDGFSTREHGGTGLGLFISRQLVLLMKGDMWVESGVGKGSTFHFTAEFGPAGYSGGSEDAAQAPAGLPVPNVHVAVPAAQAAQAAMPARLKILIAEDNEFSRKLAVDLIEKMGHSAVTVESGYEVLEALQRERFDLVLMDLQMPHMDGITAAKQIRSSQSSSVDPGIPIIALTAHAVKDILDSCTEAGMDGYITKPFRKDVLFEKIRSVVEKRKPATGQAAGSADAPREQATAGDACGAGLNGRPVDRDVLLGEVQKQLDMLKAALSVKNAPAVEQASHELKSAAVKIGDERLKRDAFRIELASRKGDLGKAAELYELFEEKILSVMRSLSDGAGETTDTAESRRTV